MELVFHPSPHPLISTHSIPHICTPSHLHPPHLYIHLHTLTSPHHPLISTPSHLHTLTSPHPHISPPSTHLHTLTSPHPHISTPSHLHNLTSPQPHISIPSHLHTLTSPHPHISHPHISTPLPPINSFKCLLCTKGTQCEYRSIRWRNVGQLARTTCGGGVYQKGWSLRTSSKRTTKTSRWCLTSLQEINYTRKTTMIDASGGCVPSVYHQYTISIPSVYHQYTISVPSVYRHCTVNVSYINLLSAHVIRHTGLHQSYGVEHPVAQPRPASIQGLGRRERCG